MLSAPDIVEALLDNEPDDDVDPEFYMQAVAADADLGKVTAATTASHFYHRTERYKSRRKNQPGAPYEARRNGRTQTWKTRPGEFRIPVKIGFKSYGYIDQSNADQWSTVPDFAEREAAAADKKRRSQMMQVMHGPVQPNPEAPPPPPDDPNQLDLFNENRSRLRELGVY